MLYDALYDMVKQYPDNAILFDQDIALTYHEFWQNVQWVAASLKAQGIVEGDRVCMLSENSVDAVTAFWAVLRCNAINVYLNEHTPAEGIFQIIEDAQPALILSTKKLAEAKFSNHSHSTIFPPLLDLATLLQASKTHTHTIDPATLSSCRNAHQIASIVYTSGSTGKPKGVSLTHANLIGVAKFAGDGYQTSATDSYLMAVPLHYIHGLMILMTMNLRGASIHFMNSFMFPKKVTEKLQETRVTGFSGVPFHFTALIERGGFLEADLPDLRWVGVTGGAFAKERLLQIRDAQPSIEIHISYGQTECSPRITALHPAKIDTKADSVGNVPEGLTVQFLGDDGEPVSAGELGELVVSGPTVMHGYWNDPENTARVIDEQGRLHTGDLAYIDPEGDVFIKGRLQAMIKSAGERIFPEELEAVINQCSVVIDVAVVGVPDELYGQRVEAHVILNPNDEASEKALRAHCLEHVSFARSPKTYHRWGEFPLKANGKTDKQRLIEQGREKAGQEHQS